MIKRFKPSYRMRKKLNRIWERIKKGYRIPLEIQYPEYKIGKGTYGNPTIYEWGEGTLLEIGAYCSIADSVKIFLGGEHRGDWVSTYPFNVVYPEFRDFSGHPHSKGDVLIGNDVWIGHGAIILSGVTIADGAIIGASSIVSKDVNPYEIVSGNPALVIKKRFSEEIIRELLKIKWWDWDDKIIKKMIPWILSNDIEKFISKAKEISSSKSAHH